MYSLIGKFTLDEITQVRLSDKHISLWDNLLKYKQILEEQNKTEDTLYIKLCNFLELYKTLYGHTSLASVAKYGLVLVKI